MPETQIYILPCDHSHQRKTSWGSGSEEAAAVEKHEKEKFTQAIQYLILENAVTLIGEEINHGIETLAQDIARDAGIRWVNVDMTLADREERKIPTWYA